MMQRLLTNRASPERRGTALLLGSLLLFLQAGCGSPGTKGGASAPETGSPDGTVVEGGTSDGGSFEGATSDGGPIEDGDAGPALPATIAVDPATKLGTIGPAFVGLSYEKAHLSAGFFRGDNAAAIAMFDLLGPSILRIGGNTGVRPSRRTEASRRIRPRACRIPAARSPSTYRPRARRSCSRGERRLRQSFIVAGLGFPLCRMSG
jgi:hypothetical protein